ncbi:MAG: carboxymuconolactone decarboxylase family protein [Bacteroidota bacterium]
MERIKYQDIPEGMFEKLRDLEWYIASSSLETRLLELIRLRVSQINGCAYCVDMHHKELKHIGETELRLASLCVWQETPYFLEKEEAALQFAEALTQLHGKPIADETFNTLTKHFSTEEICFLSLAVSQINTWNRLMKTFLLEPGNYTVTT